MKRKSLKAKRFELFDWWHRYCHARGLELYQQVKRAYRLGLRHGRRSKP